MTTLPQSTIAPRAMDQVRMWRRRQATGLAVLDTLLAAIYALYVLVPPVDGTPRGLDTGLVLLMAALVVASLTVVPRLGAWAIDAGLALTWLGLAVFTVSRPSVPGQLTWGTLLLIVALYAAYYMGDLRFGFHLAGVSAAYLVARIAAPGDAPVVFAVMTVIVVGIVAVLVHRLKRTDRRYQLLVDNTSDIIVEACEGVIHWISPSVERVLGWEPEDVVGHPVTTLVVDDDQALASSLQEAATEGSPIRGVLRMRHQDGRELWIEMQIRALPPHHGVRATVGSWRDVTSRISAEQGVRRWERLQRELAQQNEEAAEAKARLFQNISHELRTPLAIVSGPLHDLQRRSDLSPEERCSLDAAARANARMVRLIDGLLAISQGETGVESDPEPTDLTGLTRGGTDMFADMASASGLALETRVENTPPRVMVDPEAWMTILINLVSNALKYTKRGVVQVVLDYSDDTAHLCVSDTGVGIAAEDLPHVFERFDRAPNRPAHGEAGSGIGLAVVAQLVRAGGGRYEIASREGSGTTVEIWLPAPPCTPDEVSDSKHHLDVARRQHAWAWVPPSTVSLANAPSVETPRGRILVVEDNDDLRAYLTRLLREDRWEVTAVPDAETAQLAIDDHDLLLCDIMLPGASGIDLVQSIRARDDDSRWLPIILITARAGDEAVVEGLSAGADDYVTKPFSPTELLARVGTHVELSFLRQIVLDQAMGRAQNLERALGSNRAIGTALGIIMATERVSADEAFDRLRTASQHANRKLRDVADEVIYTGAIP